MTTLHPDADALPPLGEPAPVSNRIQLSLAALSLAVAFWAFLRFFSLGDQLIRDETQVVGQVQWFLQGRFELFRWPNSEYPAAATLPGFPALLSVIAAITHHASPAALRLYCFALSLVYTAVLYLTARTLLPPAHALLRAAQTLLIPIILPFNALLYTDVLSLLFNLAALCATLRRAYLAAGLLMLVSMTVRQTNVVFLLLLIAIAAVYHPLPRASPQLPKVLVRRFSGYALALAGFVAFLIIHRRVALDEPDQQSAGLYLGNLLFSLVIGAILFWPVLFCRPKAILGWIRAHPRITAIVFVLIAAICFTYLPTHRWSRISHLLRNQLWSFFLRSEARRAVLTVLVSATVFALLARPMARPFGLFLAGFWFLGLVPISLIEPRYHFPVFVLFQLFRRVESSRVEIFLWSYLAAGSIALTYLMTTTRYMP